MREPREGQARERHYLVLSRSCADLYEEIAKLFADRPSIEVVVDRRRGLDGMTEIPAARKRRAERRRRRRQASMTLVLLEPAKGVPIGARKAVRSVTSVASVSVREREDMDARAAARAGARNELPGAEPFVRRLVR